MQDAGDTSVSKSMDFVLTDMADNYEGKFLWEQSNSNNCVPKKVTLGIRYIR